VAGDRLARACPVVNASAEEIVEAGNVESTPVDAARDQ
jgi:hypothetical protein